MIGNRWAQDKAETIETVAVAAAQCSDDMHWRVWPSGVRAEGTWYDGYRWCAKRSQSLRSTAGHSHTPPLCAESSSATDANGVHVNQVDTGTSSSMSRQASAATTVSLLQESQKNIGWSM